MKYKERLLQRQEDKDQQQSEEKSELTKLQLQGDLLETQRKARLAQQELDELKSMYPLPVQEIVNKKDEVRAYNAGIADIQALQAELFD